MCYDLSAAPIAQHVRSTFNHVNKERYGDLEKGQHKYLLEFLQPPKIIVVRLVHEVSVCSCVVHGFEKQTLLR